MELSTRPAMRDVASFQPLVPSERSLAPLLERASVLVTESHGFGRSAGPLAAALAPLLREMHSYYTNKIEGQHTRPADIERALHRDFDADRENARKQRLAVAHIEAELELEPAVVGISRADLYSPELVTRIHTAIFARVPAKDRVTDDGSKVEPGAWRTTRVTAGRHVAPIANSIPVLFAAWQRAYGGLAGSEQSIVGAACAHHRLLWIHPFRDGNGRAARLHTHLALVSLGLTRGLWSPLRGMARDHAGYYARLNNADLPRRNSLDGRGALSEEELVRFADWFLDLCLDQVGFMQSMLSLDDLKGRIADLLRWQAANPWALGVERSTVKMEALEALHYTAIAGPLDRARFMAMTGLPERTSRRVLASLLDFGVLASDGPRSAVRFAVPLRSLRFLFPRLWPEAEVE